MEVPGSAFRVQGQGFMVLGFRINLELGYITDRVKPSTTVVIVSSITV